MSNLKNVMIGNYRKRDRRYSKDNLGTLMKAQIENSIELGWAIEDIILITNFEFEFMGVKSVKKTLNKRCWTGSKMFAIEYIFGKLFKDNENILWAHDLDAWQNYEFICPEFKDVGIAQYSTSRFNGGSVFWRRSSYDIIKKVIKEILEQKLEKEEPILNKVLKSTEYKDRITIVNNTFNVGCSGFAKRYNRSEKPIRVCHFHPYNRIAWETHVLDRNGLDEVAVSNRLEKLIRKYYPFLATELSEEGKRKADRIRKERGDSNQEHIIKSKSKEEISNEDSKS